ncbi:MAG: hypothetical protein WCB48_16995 [Casimicrobiaceae bacterium]
MIGQLEVVRVIDGHVFDAESYERATISESPTPPASGFYVVAWPEGSTAIPFDMRAVFAGPFATPEQANKALTEARRA